MLGSRLSREQRPQTGLDVALVTIDCLQRQLEAVNDQLTAGALREAELLKQLAEKDAQIRMVMEERFFRPHTPPRDSVADAPPSPDFGDMNDQGTFDAAADEKLVRESETGYQNWLKEHRPAEPVTQ